MPAQNRFDLHIVGDDFPLRVQRRVGLARAQGLGVVRRAAALALVAWAPPLLWASVREVRSAEPVSGFFGFHVGCLIAIPLLVLGEALARDTGSLLARSLDQSELLRSSQMAAFDRVVERHVRLRRSALPWLCMIALAALSAIGPLAEDRPHSPFWREDEGRAAVSGLGAYWYLYVSRPLFALLALGWLWRVFLWWLFLVRFARLDLELVPTHPDRAMGLGFFEKMPSAFAPFVLALASSIAANFAHRIVFHGAALSSFYQELGVFSAVIGAVVLAPLFALIVPLTIARRRALVDYGALVARHDRSVYQRWIEHQELKDTKLLDAPELGPVADVGTLFQAVVATRVVPIGKFAILSLLLPILTPMLIVASLNVPLAGVMVKLVRMLL